MKPRELLLWSLAGLPALLLILVPLLALAGRTSPLTVWETLGQRDALASVFLTLRTTFLAVCLVTVIGFPLAYLVARSRSTFARAVDAISDLPIVLPPAAAGIALLAAFGREGLVGQPLDRIDIQVTFTSAAVVIAQVFVALPYFVRSAAEGLRTVDPDTFSAGAVDGASVMQTILKIVLPQCKGALWAGILLAWARALGEFGATLMFAGNFVGRTQTVPLAIYAGFESDLNVAIALSVVLLALAVFFLVTARLAVRGQG